MHLAIIMEHWDELDVGREISILFRGPVVSPADLGAGILEVLDKGGWGVVSQTALWFACALSTKYDKARRTWETPKISPHIFVDGDEGFSVVIS